MKKCALQIISLCLALFIAFVSGGVNIYHYCCNACEESNQFIIHNSQFIIKNTQSESTHKCCTHQHTEEETEDWNNSRIEDCISKCGVTHIEAPDFSHFHTEKVSFVAPLVATIEAIHNSQFTFENETQSIASLQSIRAQYLPTNLSGRAIIVRKAAYLI